MFMDDIDETSPKATFLSIIIAAYNVEKYIASTIDSALDQDYSGLIEVIVVDDGSTDETGAICDEIAMKDQRLCVIHQENKGLYEARKSGTRAARGEYCLYLDGDDLLRKTSLERINDEIQKTAADVVLFRMCRNERFAPDACSRFHAPSQIDNLESLDIGKIREQLLTTDTINNLVTKAVKTACLNDFAHEAKSRRILMAEDKLISSFVFNRSTSAAFVDEILYFYRPNSNSIMSSSFNRARFEDLCTVHILLSELLEKWNLQACSGKFEALLISQTCEELSKLYASKVDDEEKKRFMMTICSSDSFITACKKADISSLSIHRRLTYSILRTENQKALGMWMGLYNIGMAIVAVLRGR